MLRDEISAVKELLLGQNFLEIQCPGYIYFFNLDNCKQIPSAVSVSRGEYPSLNFSVSESGDISSLSIFGKVYTIRSPGHLNKTSAKEIAVKFLNNGGII